MFTQMHLTLNYQKHNLWIPATNFANRGDTTTPFAKVEGISVGKLVSNRTFSASEVYTCPVCHDGPPMLTVPTASKMFQISSKAIYALARNQKLHAVIMPDHLTWVCQFSLREFSKNPSTLPAKKAAASLALQVVDVINRRYREPGLTLKDIASFLGKSISYVDRVLKNALGIAFRPYLRGLRLQGVVDLLRQPALSIKQVAAEMGYKSTSDMDHHFKSKYGVTPSECRRSRDAQVLPTNSKKKQHSPLGSWR